MKDKVIKLLEKDKKIKKLLNEFIEDFTIQYSELYEEDKFKILNLRDAIFRCWLNSPIIEGTYITPNFIVNNIAQNKAKGDYSVIPHIKIKVDKNDKLIFETRWIYYSIDTVPVIKDIELLINHSEPSLIVRNENMFVVDNGEKLIEELNFRSGYYIEYLIELSVKIGILNKMKAIGCEAYQVANEYNIYSNLDNREKVKLILKHSIDISNNKLEDAPYLNVLLNKNKNENIALKLLNNDIGDIQYCENIDEVTNGIASILSDIENYTEDIDAINEVNSKFYGDMARELLKQEIGIFIDMRFLSIFGYYLGVIQLGYSDFYIMEVLIDFLLKSKESVETLSGIFKLDEAHDLTPLGEILIKDYKNKVKKKFFKHINIEDINNILQCHHEEKEIFLQEYKSMNLSGECMDDFDFFEDEISENISKEILAHLQEFYIYLRDIKGLKESTCEKSAGNMELFIVDCLGLKKKKEIDEINEDIIDQYLSEWFMNKVATSRNSIKEQISSIGQYTKFLEEMGYISKDTSKAIKNMIKDKDKYLNMYDRYWDDVT